MAGATAAGAYWTGLRASGRLNIPNLKATFMKATLGCDQTGRGMARRRSEPCGRGGGGPRCRARRQAAAKRTRRAGCGGVYRAETEIDRGGEAGPGCGSGWAGRGRRVFQRNRGPSATEGEGHRGGVSDLDIDASLAEFKELAQSAGAQIAATLVQRRAKPDAATLVGQGKLEEIVGRGSFDRRKCSALRPRSDPSQLRNLDAKAPCRVIDRTQLIWTFLREHARTREGQLQV